MNLLAIDMDDVKIISNWNFDDESKLKNLITFITSDNKDCGLELVTQQSCVCLTLKENDNMDSKPELELKSQNVIKEINVLSEGSLIEVFGVHDEYLLTCASSFIDDWEGMAIYHAKIILPGVSTCRLKFTRIKERGRLWLYSVQLLIAEAQKLSKQFLFNFENINKLINNPSQQISEKADKFKKFFELYARNSSNSQAFSVQSLFNVISKECNLQYADCKKTVADCLNGSNFNSFTGNLSQKKETNKLSEECLYLKGYIDSKFKELRVDLMRHIEIKLGELKDENNSKLDRIIKLLEDSNC